MVMSLMHLKVTDMKHKDWLLIVEFVTVQFTQSYTGFDEHGVSKVFDSCVWVETHSTC